MTKSHAFQAFASIGIDVGKEVFHIVGFDAAGKLALRTNIRRSAFAREFEKLPPSVVGLEACQSAQFISRTLRRLGHTPAEGCPTAPTSHSRTAAGPYNGPI